MRIQSGRSSSRGGSRPSILSPRNTAVPAQGATGTFSELLFSIQVTDDGRPIHPTTQVPSGIDTVYATFEYADMRHGTPWSIVWMSNNKVIIDQKDNWDDDSFGRKAVKISNRKGLPDGEYHLVLGLGGSVALEGKMMVGNPVDETDSEISGHLLDARTGRGIDQGVVVVLNPRASLRRFLMTRDQSLVFTSAQSDRDGRFRFPRQLPKGNAYSLVAAANGYQHVAVDGALRLSAGAPEHADIGQIELEPA